MPGGCHASLAVFDFVTSFFAISTMSADIAKERQRRGNLPAQMGTLRAKRSNLPITGTRSRAPARLHSHERGNPGAGEAIAREGGWEPLGGCSALPFHRVRTPHSKPERLASKQVLVPLFEEAADGPFLQQPPP